MRAAEHIVIGAGISGLSMAHYAAARGIPTLVLEAEDRIGGCIQSLAFQEDFWVEGGAHTCFNSYGHLLDLLQQFQHPPTKVPKIKRHYQRWQDGQRRSLFSALHPLELLRSLLRLPATQKSGRTVADYYSRVLGRRNYQDLFRYAFRAVICQEADAFPAELLFRPKPKRKGVPRSFSFSGGLSRIPQAIATQPGIQVRTGQRVAAVHPQGEGFRIHLESGEALECRWLSLAVPPDIARQLLSESFEPLAQELAGMEMAAIDSLVFWVPVQALSLPPLAGLIAWEEDFYSVVSRDYLSHAHCRGFTLHFRAGALSRDAQLATAGAVLGIPPDAIREPVWIRNRLPALRVEQQAQIQRLTDQLRGKPLAILGNWFFGVSIEDCLMRSYEESLRLFGEVHAD